MSNFKETPIQGFSSRDGSPSLFDRLTWREPTTGAMLEPIISALAPSGVPVSGALRRAGTDIGYPITDCVVRLTPALAHRHRAWLESLGLQPPPEEASDGFQAEETVDSFGFQWSWNSAMRSEADLDWRVASRFKLPHQTFDGQLVLDAGAGAGDQSSWLLDHGAEVVSVDLSSAIDVVARKLRLRPGWVGVQGDVTALPFSNAQFGIVYCEGVIQHTRDSARAVEQLARLVRPHGLILATHYGKEKRLLSRVRLGYMNALRRRLCRWDRYKLFLLTGNVAAASYIPGLRTLLRKSGTAIYYDLMPDFKTTWTNTFDTFGSHAFQRHVTPQEFWSYFQRAGQFEALHRDGTLVAARRVS